MTLLSLVSHWRDDLPIPFRTAQSLPSSLWGFENSSLQETRLVPFGPAFLLFLRIKEVVLPRLHTENLTLYTCCILPLTTYLLQVFSQSKVPRKNRNICKNYFIYQAFLSLHAIIVIRCFLNTKYLKHSGSSLNISAWPLLHINKYTLCNM